MRAETVYSVLGKVNIIVILTRANLRYMTWEVAIHMTHDRRYAWVTEFSEPRVRMTNLATTNITGLCRSFNRRVESGLGT